MKTKLFTQKSFLVMLTLVLAFGVQGSADAINRLTRNSGDLQTATPGKDYQIRFTVGRQSPTRRSDHSDHKQTPSAKVNLDVSQKTNKTTYYDDDYDPTAGTGTSGYQDETQVYYDAAHDYEQESIAIVVSGGSTIKKVGSYDVPTPTVENTSLTMYEPTHNDYSTTSNPHRRLSGSVTLTLTAPLAPTEVTTITITPTTDGPSEHTNPSPLVFTVYTVGPLNASGTTNVGDGTDGVERVDDDQDRRIDGHFTFTTGHQPVYYSVEGSGRLYVSVPTDRDRKTSPKNQLYTSSEAPVYLDTSGGSSKVTAYIAGSGNTAKVLYIFSGGPINTHPQIEIQSGNGQTGAPSGRLDDYFEVKVTDGKRRPISGVPVTFARTDPSGITTGSMFIPVSGTIVYKAAPAKTSIDASPTDSSALTILATSTTPAAADSHHVQTDRSGVAKIYYQLSDTSGLHGVTATVYGISNLSATLNATASSDARARLANLEIVSGNNQRGEKGKYLTEDLVVIVRSLAGHRVQDAIIQFRTTTGTLVPAEGTDQPDTVFNQPLGQPLNPRSGQQIYVETGPDGEAGVSYNVGQVVEARDVIAEVREEAQQSTQYDFAIDRVTFNINGKTGSTTTPQQPQQPTAPTATSVPTTVSGTAGGTASLLVTAAANTTVTAGGLNDTLPVGSASSFTRVGTTYTSTVSLPSTAGTYSLSVFVGATPYPVSVNVTAGTTTTTTQTGTVSVDVDFSGAIGSQADAKVTATDSDGKKASGVVVSLSVTNGGGVFTPARVTTGTDGTATSTLTRGTTAGTNYFVTASATGYDNVPSRISITSATPTTGSTPTTPTTPTPTPTTPTTPTPTAGTPDLISIDGEATRTGTVNEELDAPLVVEVLDSKGTRVRNARVTFRVRKGQGRLSQRGNGRAVAATTNTRGLASADYTPLSASSTVEASVRGVSETVTFTITTDGASTTTTPDTTTPDTTTPDPADVTLKVGAANRPVMYWITGGALYRQGTGDATQLAASAKDVVVDTAGGKLYWIEQQTESTGAIHSANLDGANATVVKTLTSAPMGLALDTANKKLYLTNGWGKIQRMNIDGSAFETNLITGLASPGHVAASGGNVYWTEGSGTLRFMTAGSTSKSTLVTGSGAIGGLIADSSKVYWTEQTGERSGRIHSANLDGTGISTVFTITAVVHGIAIDGATGDLYWTNGWGKIQTGASTGGGFKDVATGLMTPGTLAIGGANTAAATPTTTTPTTTAAGKYDLNGDGSVNSADVDLLLLAVVAGVTTAKYDLNADGAVDIQDVMALNQNLDAGAAAAPTLLGAKFSALEVNRLQEQIDLLIATGDRSPAAMKTLIYLQQLIAMARPEKTQLLANYPNPFNPETWIPYELSTDTDVTLTIYNAQGVVVRVLHLGQQSAGYYTDRERAAYWDGRNSQGEQVASGVYFYQLETDEMSALRKMVILK